MTTLLVYICLTIIVFGVPALIVLAWRDLAEQRPPVPQVSDDDGELDLERWLD
jgi:hypothetical protein